MCCLPQDVLVQILSTLPPETLVRLLSVCKSWRSTIAHPYFIAHHLQTTDYGRLLVRTSSVSPSKPSSFDVTGLVFPETRSGPMLGNLEIIAEEPPTQTLDHRRVEGICKGVFCYQQGDGGQPIALCNPTLRRTILVPRCPLFYDKQSFPTINFHSHLGLGFDSINSDYKIVLITTKRLPNHQPRIFSEAAIFSLNSNSWKQIKWPVPSQCARHPHSVSLFLHGFVHWLCSKCTNTGPNICPKDCMETRIVVFDVHYEAFGEIRLPETIMSNVDAIQVVRGLLCVMTKSGSDDCFGLWVMKEYGVNESWSEQYRFKLPWSSVCEGITVGGRIICSSFKFEENDDKSKRLCFHVNLYDPETGEYMNLCRQCIFFDIISFQGSLQLLDYDV